MTRTTAHRVHCNSAPMAGVAPILPMERARPYHGTLRLTALLVVGLFAFGLLLWGMG